MSGKSILSALKKLNILDDIDNFLDKKAQAKVAASARIGAAAALEEVPMLDALFDGEEIEIVHKVQLRRKQK